jgi:hypothetical protein
MLNPFQMVWELVVFGLQALFVYVLALIIIIGILFYVIADNREHIPAVEYVEVQYPKVIEELVCTRIDGCRVRKDGTVEY